MILALGRRSQVRGIPDWLTWPVAIVISIWGFTQSTPAVVGRFTKLFRTFIAYWPFLILFAAWALQRVYKGKCRLGRHHALHRAGARCAIDYFAVHGNHHGTLFLQGGSDLPKPYAVIAGYTIFASAYMAELIRGGLQAIPKGQFEAADAIGLNTLQKMRFIILPQALRILIPGLVGSFIGNFNLLHWYPLLAFLTWSASLQPFLAIPSGKG